MKVNHISFAAKVSTIAPPKKAGRKINKFFT
jgi:hypothetical protein